MQSERAREAAEYRAKGSETARTITATADRDVVVLRGNAQRQGDQLRDEGDVEAGPGTLCPIRGSVVRDGSAGAPTERSSP
jgi:regulator of protease activity HflC (stomatin/prohibitin superfamily)